MKSIAKPPRIDVGAIRREQIVDAAANIIAARGIQHLSLSAIEAETGMSRGQLTYYFRTKEDILLAVFDRTVRRMQDRMAESEPQVCAGGGNFWQLIQSLLQRLLTQPAAPDFAQLQYSFLAQMAARDDFRQRLASLYENWRRHMADDLRKSIPNLPGDAQLVASFIQALLHGLVLQLQADPEAFDRTAMLELCLRLLEAALKRPRPSNGRSHLPAGR